MKHNKQIYNWSPLRLHSYNVKIQKSKCDFIYLLIFLKCHYILALMRIVVSGTLRCAVLSWASKWYKLNSSQKPQQRRKSLENFQVQN